MKTAIIDQRASEEIERALMKMGFLVLRTHPAKALPAPLAHHPDMLMLKIGNTLLSSAEYAEEALPFFEDLNFYTGMDFSLSGDEFSSEYPNDCIFNALTMGDIVFCKTDSVSPSVLSLARRYSKRIVHVNQGYPACTVLPLGDKAAITADRGMASALLGEGIDVVLIENGGISLPPYEYGFIGGAAGVWEDTVCFLGDPELHPDGEKITAAVKRAGLRSVALSSAPLCDLGRIIFVD